MKKILFCSLLIYSFTLNSATDDPFAPAPMNTSEIFTEAPQTTNSVQGGKKKGGDKKEEKGKEKKQEVIPAPVALPKPIAQEARYFHPGILALQNGVWNGSDHLLNLANKISVYFTLVKPKDLTIEIPEKKLKEAVEASFKNAGILPQTMALEGYPPLPAFEVQIFIYPIERGFVSSISGRLFESVTLDRFRLDQGTAFQAITWEKQSLLVSPTSQFIDQLSQSVDQIADSFTTRYQAYQKLKPS